MKVRLAQVREAGHSSRPRTPPANTKLEIEADTALRLRQLELEAQQLAKRVVPAPGSAFATSPSLSNSHFDISKHVALMPTFREAEADSYFNAFEHLAIALKWPKEMWPLLLQCKINGKAQEVVSLLPLTDSLKYDVVKEAILRAYRQKFRGHRKSPSQLLSSLETRELYSIVGALPLKLQIVQSCKN